MMSIDICPWPGWNIVREIGRGSFGRVYEIHRKNDVFLEKAALKVIHIPSNEFELNQYLADGLTIDDVGRYLEQSAKEIRNEIGIMQKFVGYSNIVSYEDYLIQKHENDPGWDIFIRMELLTPLSDYMKNHRFSERDVLRLGLDISQALVLCHGSGIIHRDIKPQNIFVNNHGFFKLGDFGISRSMAGSRNVLSFKGTISYMAPETFAMQNTDARSDVYSLALVLYRFLNNGREPFLPAGKVSREQVDSAQRRRLAGEALPAPENGSRQIWNVLRVALEANPASRYQTSSQFHEALKKVEKASTSPTVNSQQKQKPVNKPVEEKQQQKVQADHAVKQNDKSIERSSSERNISLQDILRVQGPQNADKVIDWSKQICDSLAYLHSRRPPVVYQRVRPDNVILRFDGNVILKDVYQAGADNARNKDISFAAPEQFRNQRIIDGRTDIFALGATMHTLLTGKSPVVTNAGVVPVGAIVPQLKGSGLEKIILKCCSQEPSNRYQNCAELMYALEHAHEEDDSAIQHRNRVWKAFLICAIFTLLLLFVGGGSRLMAMNKRTQLYKQYVQTASANVNFSDKLALYKKAIDLDPGNPEAYQKLIDDIDSLLDDEFVAAYNSITDCINGVDYDPASRKRNIEYLNDRDAATYSDFNFRLGTLVYLVYPSGQGASISYLNEAVETGGLEADRQESAELILRLAELYKKTKEAGQNKNTIVFEHEFADYWATLDDLSIRLDTLKSQTNIAYPIRICDTIATEINLHCVNYMNDNVARDTILQTLDRANNFMNNAESSSPDQLEVIKRVRSNVTKAYGSVDDCFSNTSKVNPDAADSEEEGGDI